MLEPPETLRTTGTGKRASTDVLRIPLVNIRESQYFSKGWIVFLGTSRLSVGPKKYP
jgi:hypothetical protein